MATTMAEIIQNALSGIIPIDKGKYPDSDLCAKIVFIGEDKPVHYLGGGQTEIETFMIIIKGNDYGTLEAKADEIKIALKNQKFIQIGGYADIEPKEGEMFLQLAVHFKSIK